jgi:hypothetical protein
MRFSFITPHQFEPFQPYVDTLIIASHTGIPCDVAVPHGAAEWISRELAERLYDRYPGRTSWRDGGLCGAFLSPDESALEALTRLAGHTVRFGVWLVERRLVAERHVQHTCGAAWLVWDWWRWLWRRVEPQQFTNALFYLCCAIPAYRTSQELSRLGIDPLTLQAMADEGDRLFARMVSHLSTELQQLWARM